MRTRDCIALSRGVGIFECFASFDGRNTRIGFGFTQSMD